MGKKSMAKKPKGKDRLLVDIRESYADRSDVLVLTQKEYAALEKKTIAAAYEKARTEFHEKFQTTVPVVQGYAELNALVQIMRLTALGAHDLFGFGSTRIKRLTDYILLEYDCVLQDRVKFSELLEEVKALTGLELPAMNQEDLARMLNDSLDTSGSILPAIEGLKYKDIYELRVKEGEKCDTQK